MTRLLGMLITVVACHPTTGEVAPIAPRSQPPPGAPAAAPASVIPSPLARIAHRIGSPVILARTGDTTLAYVADEDAGTLRVVDVDRQDELATLELGGKPAQLVMLDDHRLVASLRDRDELVVLAGAGLPDHPLAIVQRIAMPAEPIGLALSPDDRTLVATSGWGHALVAIAVPRAPHGALAPQHTWSVADEPRAVVVSDDGRYAFVSHMIGQHLERIDLADRSTKRLGLAGIEDVTEEMSGMFQRIERKACQGFALAKSIAPAGRIFAPQVLAATGNAAESSEGYGGGGGLLPEVLGIAIIDEDRGKVIPESLALRDVTHTVRCALPRAAAASASGSLFVACLGADRIYELDGAGLAPATVELRQWTVPAGPTAIAIDDANERAIVWSQYAQSLTTISTKPSAGIARTLVLDDGVLPAQLARGRALFAATEDRRISTTGQGCESCHPDGRQDALVWSSPNGPRQTPMLAGRLAGTGPFGWNGDTKSIEKHLKQTFSRLGGSGLAGDDLAALVAYVTAMPAPGAQSPANAALVAEGEALFRSDHAQCASCHGDDGREPDGVRHDVRSRAMGDHRGDLDTPSLAYVGYTAPYYHDGRFATLRELLAGTHKQMGQTRKLDARELAALEAYLRTR